jgi:hypothetical protein
MPGRQTLRAYPRAGVSVKADGPPIDADAAADAEVLDPSLEVVSEPPEEPLPVQTENAVGSPSEGDESLAPAMAAWTEALRSVERSINDAVEAIRFLRETVQQMAPLLHSLGGLEEALSGFAEKPRRPEETPTINAAHPWPRQPEEVESEAAPSVEAPIPRAGEGGHLGRGWQALRKKPVAREKAPRLDEAERGWAPSTGPSRPSLKPVTLVPDDTPAAYAYRVTFEDRKNSVELMKLHQALTSIPSVRNLSLLNYANGVASMTVETTDELQPPELENAVRKAMKRSCSVVPHDSNTILVQVGD